MSLSCSADTPHKRAVLEAIEEEATETDISLSLSHRTKLRCARCQDAVRYMTKTDWFYPSWYRQFYSRLQLFRMNWHRFLGRLKQSYEIMTGKMVFFPGRDYPVKKRPETVEEVRRRQEYNLAVQSILERKNK